MHILYLLNKNSKTIRILKIMFIYILNVKGVRHQLVNQKNTIVK